MRLRVAVRLAEAAALSILAGAFVWVLRGLIYPLPIVFVAFLGFLTGGVATMRTLGVTFLDRTQRMAIAITCAALGYGATQGLDYYGFLRYERQRQAIVDYRAGPRLIDQRIASELEALTGYDGFPGYVVAAMREGVPVLGLRLRGVALGGFWLLELTVATVVAARWAGGPRRQQDGAT